MSLEIVRRFLDGKWQTVAETEESGSGPVNWARIAIANPGSPLTLVNETHHFLASELSISEQAGTDFSVGAEGGDDLGVILSAAGGRFQCATYLANPDNATLDAGSEIQRYVLMAAVVGDATGPLGNFGLDAMVPILPSPAQGRFLAANCCASALGYADPGGSAVSSIKVSLINGFGTDSVPLSAGFGFDNFIVWQV